jgi:exodeoxyribonuclease VII large subunit
LSGAALRDVLHVIRRRQPALQIVLVDSRVQGQGAEVEIAKGIERLNEWTERESLDLILLTRGGGSLEDLWAFNEETLARAIAASAVPVVSAVGHEIDFTISDFTADYRAATPSAAAEIITAGAVALEDSLKTTRGRLQRLVAECFAREQERVGTLAHRLGRCHPRRRLQEQMQRVDELHDDLLRAAQSIWKHNERRWRELAERLLRVRPELIVARQQAQLAQLRDRLQELPERQVSRADRRIKSLGDQLRLLGPENVLARGYSITQDAKTGEVLRASNSVKTGQKLRTRLADGEVESTAG